MSQGSSSLNMKFKRKFKMGNVLCKNKQNQAPSTKGSSNGLIGRCTQICSHPINKKKHFWDKQILETSPPRKQVPKENETGWSTVTLNVPDNTDGHPIPPPRKKRQHKHQQENLLNGLTDSQNSLDRLSTDEKFNEREVIARESDVVIVNQPKISDKFVEVELDTPAKIINKEPVTITEELKIEISKQQAKQLNEDFGNDKNQSPSQNIPKIGNRKSDKFFGENLSESLSNEPTIAPPPTPATDGIDNIEITLITKEAAINSGDQDQLNTTEKETIEKDNVQQETDIKDKIVAKDEIDRKQTEIENVEESEEMIHQINKEKGNLLFSIQNQFPTDKDKEIDIDPNAVPVVEELIVPVRRITHHICDDETHFHKILHKSNPPEPIPPKKPQRDLSKYRKSFENQYNSQEFNTESNQNSEEKNIEDEIIKVTPISAHISQDDIQPSAIEVPKKKAPPPPPPTYRSQLRNSSSREVTPEKSKETDPMIHRSQSPDSLSQIASDLVETITQQASDIAMSTNNFKLDKTILNQSTKPPVEPTTFFSQNTKPSVETAITVVDSQQKIPNGQIKNDAEKLNDSNKSDETQKLLELDAEVPKSPTLSDIIKNTDEILDNIASPLLPSPPSSPVTIQDAELPTTRLILTDSSFHRNDNEKEKKCDITIGGDVDSPIKLTKITSTLETQSDLKSPGIINRALESVMSNEKQHRHSMEDLDSWFSKTIEDDNTKLGMKRERSLPNTLEITTTPLLRRYEDIDGDNDKFEDNHVIGNSHPLLSKKITTSEIILTSKNDHSPLLKFLENEKANNSVYKN